MLLRKSRPDISLRKSPIKRCTCGDGVHSGRGDDDRRGGRRHAGIGQADAQSWPRVKIPGTIENSGWGKGEKPNEYQDIATYNNFYEFGTEKDDPASTRTRSRRRRGR